MRVRKTHDITQFGEEAAKIAVDYAALDEGAKHLTEYAAGFRYPNVQLEPTQKE